MSISIIPDSAPFSSEQRAWLNGFLAGWTGMEGQNGQASAGGGGVETLPEPAEEEEDFPWHDSGMPIDQRLELAAEKPLNRRLMSAMAQLNCGACGYVCKTYSEAIAAGEEKNLKLCSPGGKDTAKAIKRLLKEEPAGAAGASSDASHGAATLAKPTGYSRSNPYTAAIKESYNLNGDGSAKYTSHVVIDLGDSGLTYHSGDSLGVYPTNCPELVEDILSRLGHAEDAPLGKQLTQEFNLRDASDELLELLAASTPDADEELAVASLIDSDELDNLDVLDVLRRAPSAKIGAEEFVDCLAAIAPRLYSIASSPNAHPREVHLTVGKATTRNGERVYKGVASTMFSDRVARGDAVRVFVQPSHGFSVPDDPNTPMIMVGPGTGIAPFRAFLQERQASVASGKNWLFFGDQHEATDFLYEEELGEMQSSGLLTRLSTAFSRDQAEKVYVQDRMREAGAVLWNWLDEGGSFFVCGDAKRMAADVDSALHDAVAEHGDMTPSAAKAYIDQLKEQGRYSRDVY